MGSEPLLETAFLIPIRRDNELSDGKHHSVSAWNWLEDSLYEQFDGRTIAPGLYQGMWKSGRTGRPVDDSSRKYIVALPRSRLDDLRQLLAEACRVFHQQCIYLSIAGQVEFVEAPRDEATG